MDPISQNIRFHPLPWKSGSWQMPNRFRSLFLVTMITLLTSSLAVAEEEEPGPPPKPRSVELTTKDGVRLNAIYYEGTEGEATVPVM